MADILETISEYAKFRTEERKREIPLTEMIARAGDARSIARANGRYDLRFEKSLQKDEIAFICECKKASPSKGLIADHFPYVDIAREYETAGASCISVLTEPKWFLGSGEYLKQITEAVNIPCLRKDFVVDKYMVYEAVTLGAEAVLLIVSVLGDKVGEYIELCDELGLSALVEAHDEEEVIKAKKAGARIIGVNNRNLRDFTVDMNNSIKLRNLVPDGTIFVAESGIKTANDINVLRNGGVNAVLIGETLMRAPDKKAMLDELRGAKKIGS